MADARAVAPLEGVKVLEITTMVAGPIAGVMLADLGATVTKLESMSGDPLRYVNPQHKGMCAHFFAVNRHKRSIQVDLKSDEGRAIAHSLAAKSDVILVNSRPSAMKRLGLGYEQLKMTNPGLIYVSISGFGDDGPYADRPAFDQVIQALTGGMVLQHPEGQPSPLRSMFVDKFAGTARQAPSARRSIIANAMVGTADIFSVPLMKSFSFLCLVDNLHNHAFVEGNDTTPIINITRPIRSADGMFMGHIQADGQFAKVCSALGIEHLLNDDRFTSPVKRVTNYAQMWQEIEKGAAAFTSDQLEALAVREGLPLGKVNTINEFLDDPQCRHLECVKQFDTAEYGPVRAATHPADFSCDLHFDDGRIASLRSAGVIR